MKKILAGTAAALFAMTTMASAASFTLDLDGLDGVAGGGDDAILTTIPGGLEGPQPQTPTNAVLQELGIGTLNAGVYELQGYQGSQVMFSGGGKVRVELFGWEAGFENSFTLDGQTVGKGLNGVSASTQVVAPDTITPLDSFVTGILGAGLLEFEFDSENGGNDTGGVANGDNPIIGQNFFASFAGDPTATSGKVLWLFYDDGAVFGDNHDDLVIRISAVPLPAGAVLLLTGLGALALRRRRKAA